VFWDLWQVIIDISIVKMYLYVLSEGKNISKLLQLVDSRGNVGTWKDSQQCVVSDRIGGLQPLLPKRTSTSLLKAQRHLQGRRQPEHSERLIGPWGSAINYPENPRFRPTSAFKVTATTEDMHHRSRWLSDHAIVITEEGPMGVQSKDEVKGYYLPSV
jgi:hypothetical protein